MPRFWASSQISFNRMSYLNNFVACGLDFCCSRIYNYCQFQFCQFQLCDFQFYVFDYTNFNSVNFNSLNLNHVIFAENFRLVNLKCQFILNLRIKFFLNSIRPILDLTILIYQAIITYNNWSSQTKTNAF